MQPEFSIGSYANNPPGSSLPLRDLEAKTLGAVELTKGSLHSFGWCKQLLIDSFHTSFESHIERERQGLSSCAAHPDGQEGLKAFSEKRKPKFNVK
jgi:enoyl-CoA hydratase/carnithine racemase